ncbi:hypothetical protein ACICHK_08080 [Streptomyces sp. AHU1]|uniref:hypothetical protein n=1 Tax=Streptomyces sp. AHU1 TaxID=3377215 RepID=UPI003877CE4E
MTAPGAWALRTRASRGTVRWARAAVIVLLTALAVLVHHEMPTAEIGSTDASAVHVMTPDMVMAGSHAAPGTVMSGHGHGSNTGRAAEPTTAVASTTSGSHGPACSGADMQHCSVASLDVVKLASPSRTSTRVGLAAYGAVPTGPKGTGIVDRAPPDLSVLSQLRI